ncbi:hypothetical protein Patl1_29503 [Pistacia atlantica]|uniref:Uncharacterized protein n=1 Tax=Pistacia atlantica TaxID=434234 RepID=A0ACC1A913_9ROSI|nr:hypothetical protein Patl1_29503 [Pistacia atlantica]
MGSMTSDDEASDQQSERCGSYSLSADVSESESCSSSFSYLRFDAEGASSSLTSSPRPVSKEKNPMGKRNISTPVDDQPSPRLASDAETYAEKTSTEVESGLQSDDSLVPDTGNYFATNISAMGSRNLDYYQITVCFMDQRNIFAPITSSMAQSQLLPNHSLGFDPRYKFPDDNSPMVQPQLQSNHSKEFDPRNHFVPNTSSMLLPHQNLDSLMVRMNMLVRPQLLSNHNMVFDAMNHSAPCTSSMQVEPQLLSNQNMGFDPINHSASITSSMEHPQPVAELFAQFTAIFGRFMEGLKMPGLHKGISRINILKKQLDKTLPTDNINTFMDEQSVDIPLDLN